VARVQSDGQFIKQIVNDIRENRMSITIRPDGMGATDKNADIYSGLVRRIQYDSAAQAIYDNAVEQAVTAGRGYWRVINEYEREDSFNQRLRILPIPNGLNVYLDPSTLEPDKSDAQWGFVLDWIDKDSMIAEWGDAAAGVSWDESDQSEWVGWFNGTKVCVADYYELVHEDDTLLLLGDGSTIWASDVKVGFPVHIKKSEKRKRTRCVWYKLTAQPEPLAVYQTPFKHIPIVCCVGDEMSVDGKVIYRGIVRNLRDAAMLYNYFFTSAAECVTDATKAPWMVLAGQTEGHPEWDDFNVETYPKMEYEPVELPDGTFHTQPPIRNDRPPLPADLVQMCGLCANLFREITGLKDPALGNHTQEQSSLAILARNRISDTATFHYVDNLSRAVSYTGKIITAAIPQTYVADQTLMLVNQDGTQQKQRVNYAAGQMRPDGSLALVNDLRVGCYSCVVDTGPSYQTQRVEAANKLVEFMGVMDPSQRAVVTDLAAKVIDMPDKLNDRIAARLFALLPPQAQMADAEDSPDPKVQALVAAMQKQQQQSQQAVQGLQQQLTDVQQTNVQLETMLLNKTKEIEAKSHDSDVKSSLAVWEAKLDAVVKLITSKATNPTAVPTAAAEAGEVNNAATTMGAPA
jgi:hypothetical protein